MKIVLIDPEELRALISEELNNIKPVITTSNEAEPPISQQEMCRFLNITEPTLIRWKRKGLIPFLQVGSRVLFQKGKVVAALERVKKDAKKHVR